jgi:ribonuclease J
MSALALLARGENRFVKVGATDTVILSSHAIPGNERGIYNMLNNLAKHGATIITAANAPIHATGHAKQEELKTILSITRPEWFTPVHGEYRHLMAHAGLARTMGVADDHVLVCEDGDQLVLTDGGIERRDDAVPAGYLYVDGIVGDVGGGVLRDRKVLAEEGVVVVVVTVDAKSGAIVTGPEVITRGWVYAPEAEDLLDGAREAVVDAIKEAFAKDAADIEALQRVVRRTVGRYVNAQTKRRPMIVPVVMET